MNRNMAKTLTIAILAGLALGFSASGGSRVPPDHSLTVEQYVDLGMPVSGVNWTADERSTARSILRKLASQDPTQLPRFRSKRSGALFEKLTREEVFRRDELEGRMGELTSSEFENLSAKGLEKLAYGDSLEAIYAPESTGGLLFDRERVEICEQQLLRVLQLRSESDAVQARVDAIASSGERGGDTTHGPLPDPTLQKKYLKHLDRLFFVCATKLAVYSVAQEFTAEARADAAAHLLQHVPEIAPLLSEESRAGLERILREVSSTPGADPRLAGLLHTW